MTRNRALKQAVRGRMADTGQRYTAARRAVAADEAVAELDRQVATLVARGYPALAGLDAAAFAARLTPLRDVAAGVPAGSFLLVVTGELVPAGAAARLLERHGRPAALAMLGDDELARFVPIDDVALRDRPAYLLLDVDTGAATRNVTPEDALGAIRAGGRSPLTVEEGIALVTHRPEAVAPNAGFSLRGSRCGDRRVPAIWISKGAPKLGWCWAGNPHTWLGSASCAGRLG